MHYKDGTPIQLGDVCKFTCGTEIGSREEHGIVVRLNPGATSCNIMVSFMDVELVREFAQDGKPLRVLYAIPKPQTWWMTASNCELHHRAPELS